MSSYYFKEYNYSNGIFDNIVDITYILLMEDSPREKQVLENIETFKLSKKVIIQYNKGFKKCKKDLIKQTTNYDLSDAYNNVFLHSIEHNFKTILVLEDDFMFDQRIYDKNIIHDIEKLYQTVDVNIFNLGTALAVLKPLSIIYNLYNCKKLIVGSQSHAVIYSRKFIDKYTNNYKQKKIKVHYDLNFSEFFIDNIYTYKIPLSYQLLYETENFKQWHLNKYVMVFIKLLKLDKTPQPGFDILYKLQYIFSAVCYTLILTLVYKDFNFQYL